MRIDITTNLSQVKRQLTLQAMQSPEAVREGIGAATRVLYALSRNLLTRLIYNRPIPKWKNGKPKWRRTFALRNAERMATTAPYRSLDVQGQVFTDPGSTAWRYHVRRHNLEGPREARWREEAVKQAAGRAGDAFRRVILAWLNRNS